MKDIHEVKKYKTKKYSKIKINPNWRKAFTKNLRKVFNDYIKSDPKYFKNNPIVVDKNMNLLVVDKNMNLLDGNRRLIIAKEMNENIYYVFYEDLLE